MLTIKQITENTAAVLADWKRSTSRMQKKPLHKCWTSMTKEKPIKPS